MKLTKKAVSLLMAMCLMVAVFAGCSSNTTTNNTTGNISSNASQTDSTSDSEAAYSDTLIYSMNSAPDGGFIPVDGLSDYDGGVCNLIYASLMTANSEGILEPYLAESCTSSEDGTVYTYKLREGAVWSDGEPVTTEDVAFTFELAAAPENDGGYSTMASTYIKGADAYHAGTADTIEGIRIVDDLTIEFTTNGYFSKAESFLGQQLIIPEHIWRGIPFTEMYNVDREMQDYPVCCGPYRVEELVSGEYVKLVANDNFFLGAPLTKNLIIKVVNSESISAELMSGAVDIADVTNLTNDEIDTLTAQGFETTGYYFDLFQYAQFNPDRQFSTDFRKAVFYAIDRQGMVDTLMGGRGTVIDFMITAASWAYPHDIESPKQDLDLAREYLAAAGYSDVDGDGFVEDPTGNPFVFDIYVPLGLAAREQSAVVIQSNLAEIGIKVEISSFEFSAFWSAVQDNEYDMILMGAGADSIDPDPTNFLMALTYSDKMYELGAEAASTYDREKRIDLYRQMTQLHLEELPAIVLYCQERTFAYPSNLINYEPGTYNPYYHAYLWALEK